MSKSGTADSLPVERQAAGGQGRDMAVVCLTLLADLPVSLIAVMLCVTHA